MLKKIVLLTAVMLSVSSFALERPWQITKTNFDRGKHELTLSNGTVWRFKKDKDVYVTRYVGRYSYQELVPGRDDDNIYQFEVGDTVEISHLEEHVVVFQKPSDPCGQHRIGCVLSDFRASSFPKIDDMDRKGYQVVLTNGRRLNFSWCQAWSSYYWQVNDHVLPLGPKHGGLVLNLTRLKGLKASPYAKTNCK